jgi:hypothetical protein
MKGLDVFRGENFYLRSAQSLLEKWAAPAQHPWLLQKKADFTSPGLEADQPRLRDRDTLFRNLYTDFHFVQLPSVLRNFDRLSMAHGVEVRSPFMDWRLICFLFSLPFTSKIGSGFTKRILRDAMRGILPESIRTRTQKLGFISSPDVWSSPRGQEFVHDLVASAEFQQSSIWNGSRLAADLNNAISKGKVRRIQRAAIYVQAMSLMRLFREKRQMCQAGDSALTASSEGLMIQHEK